MDGAAVQALSAVVLVGNGMAVFSNVQRVFISFTVLFGRFAEAAIIGSVAQLVANLNAAASRHQERADVVQETVRYLNIPDALQARARAQPHANTRPRGPPAAQAGSFTPLPLLTCESSAMLRHDMRAAARGLGRRGVSASTSSSCPRARTRGWRAWRCWRSCRRRCTATS